MEMKAGYKSTELGIIPSDWEVTSLSDFVSLQRGHDLTWRDRKAGSVPVMGSAGQNGFHNKALVEGPGIVLGRSGASFGQAHFCHVDFWPHNTALYVTEFHGNDPVYAYHLLREFDFARFNSGGAQPSLNRNFIGPIKILRPKPLEQLAIATALSDVEALIAGLERLTAKKKDIKQAAMQQLLSGQTRLPGFVGEWANRQLGELGATYGGLVGKSKADFGHGAARYVPFVNVMANVRIDCAALENVNVAASEYQNRVLAGDLLFNGSSETPEEVALCALMGQSIDNVYLNSFCFGFRLKAEVAANGLFLAYLFRSQFGRELMKSLAQGSTRYNLSKLALLRIELKLPPVDEQTAIADVLSDMDAVLSALESRLKKTRAIKQGMTQELLSGRTRLV